MSFLVSIYANAGDCLLLVDYEGASHEALRLVEKYTEKAFTWDLHGEIVGRRPHGPDGWYVGNQKLLSLAN